VYLASAPLPQAPRLSSKGTFSCCS
jgi:hypothetical protein